MGGAHGEEAEAPASPALQMFHVSSTETRADLVRCV